MNQSDLVINGTKIQWSKNFSWIREICQQEIQNCASEILKKISGRLDSCQRSFFSNSSAEEGIIREAAGMLEYSIKGKYLEDQNERLAYWRVALEKDKTYSIFLGNELSRSFPEIKVVAEKILKEYEARQLIEKSF